MTLGIIAAMSEELEILLKDMEVKSKETKANMTFHQGTLWGQEVVAVVCGIGKVNAAVCTQILISEYKVDKVINVGVAGGIGMEIYPGDVVIKCSQELVDLCEEACKENEEIKSFTGRIVTGDQFVASVEKVKWLEEEFGASACEMEGGSIAHVCYLNNIPFLVIRSISDNANNGAHMDFAEFTAIGVKNSTSILKSMILKMA